VLTSSEIVELHGLVGHWKLTETSGTTAIDSTLNVSNGTYTNGVSLGTSTNVPGYNVKAAVFDGTNDYVAVPNESLYDITGSLSVAAWIKVTSFTSAWQAIVTKGDSAWRISRSNSTNFVHFAWGSALSPKYIDGVTNVSDGKWHHVCGVYDGSTLKLYVDGQLDASAAASGAVTTNDYAVQIGQNAEQSGRNWNGAVYDARVYNRAITAEEVSQLYGTGFAGVVITKWVELQ
jgi:Concanavalin A-like lectin/glucanases superfamily